MDILIVDDDELVCQSLKTILEADPKVRVVGTGHDGEDAVKLYGELEPDILLMDIRMKRMLGTEAAKTILASHPDAKILFLTTFMDDEYISDAIACGGKGYLLKQEYESLLPAVSAVYSGQTVFGSDVISKLPKVLAGSAPSNDGERGTEGAFDGSSFGLTEKESEIVACVAEGMSNKEIAAKLFLSEGTVRNYLSTILEKLELRDRTQLAVFYYKQPGTSGGRL
ncbi:MAG: response regulator transcription factor [Lachnospiraceae bacterium]|nr:response regulator transcription factor [Lachnospiraceae bacterium]